MRRPTPSTAAAITSILALLSAHVHAFDCNKILADSAEWNLSKLGGLHQVAWIRDAPSGAMAQNTTFKISLCKAIDFKDASERQGCKHGTRICGINGDLKDGETTVRDYIPIVRQDVHENAHLDAKRTRLKTSDSNTDSQKEGLRLRLGGGKYQKRDQEAIIEFLCKQDGDKVRRRLRSQDDDDDDKDKDKDKDHDDDKKDEGEHKEEWDAARKTDDGVGGEIKILSYEEDQLRLEWHTPFGCEDAEKGGSGDSGDNGDGGGGGWGFFSWFFFLLFIGVLLYFGFSAWMNYTRYGAHGWDLIPHADTIRDIPYILGDWWRKIVGTISGGGSRGGYSAV